ncbi:MAG: 50S ribosomal protein L11 methyltransferase [Hyphomicrobiaceae bacterium]|nr:methyltransferase [Hyphomicrobiaceae bacterium]
MTPPDAAAPSPLKLDRANPVSIRHFIRTNTKLLSPPLVPEIKLHLAEESVPIWQKTEDELGELNIDPPYWAFAWAGGQALARYLLDTPTVSNGKRILDLGAGSGLTAIAPMLRGATSALAADIDELALIASALNADANGVTVSTTAEDLLVRKPENFDVILVGDLFYERQLADKVLAYINAARASGAEILIGDPGRNYFPRNRFEQIAEYRVPVTRELEDAEIKKTAVWRVA